LSFFAAVSPFISGQHKRPMSLSHADMPLKREIAKKFGYAFDETGSCHIQNEEAAVVRFVFTRYVNDHKPMDVLPFNLPMEVGPGALGGKEWLRRHVHAILSDSNNAGVQATPTGLLRGHTLLGPVATDMAIRTRRRQKAPLVPPEITT
jgi:hypothetical protein